MNLFCVIALSACGVTAGDARLGETLAECTARYGTATSQGGEYFLFHLGKIDLQVRMGKDGKARNLEYFRPEIDKWGLGGAHVELTKSEIDGFLAVNGKDWKEVVKSVPNYGGEGTGFSGYSTRIWKLHGGTVLASYGSSHRLMISDNTSDPRGQ
jgi:hypothetical protein